MPCGWGGNRRSGVALAMHHRLQWFIHPCAHCLRKGDEHPACPPHGVFGYRTLCLAFLKSKICLIVNVGGMYLKLLISV